MTSDPIDYSRPVGWWCPVCDCSWSAHTHTLTHLHQGAVIPRYLPLPTPEPVEVDEVETGEAEVVTMFSSGEWWYACPDGSFSRWAYGIQFRNDAEHHINTIAYESARKKREMK
jgi:hypothetical protein